MPEEYSRSAQVSRIYRDQAEHNHGRRIPETEEPAAELIATQALPHTRPLLGDRRLNTRGNGPVRAATMLSAQRSSGNRAVQRDTGSGGNASDYSPWGFYGRMQQRIQQEAEKSKQEEADAWGKNLMEGVKDLEAKQQDPWSPEGQDYAARYAPGGAFEQEQEQARVARERADQLARPRTGLPEMIIGGIGSQISPQLAQIGLTAADAVQDAGDVAGWAGGDVVDALDSAHKAQAAQKGPSLGPAEMAWGTLAPQILGSPQLTATGFGVIGGAKSAANMLGGVAGSLLGGAGMADEGSKQLDQMGIPPAARKNWGVVL